MPMNRVQYQPDLSKVVCMRGYGTLAQREADGAAMPWPSGFLCPAGRCRLDRTPSGIKHKLIQAIAARELRRTLRHRNRRRLSGQKLNPQTGVWLAGQGDVSYPRNDSGRQEASIDDRVTYLFSKETAPHWRNTAPHAPTHPWSNGLSGFEALADGFANRQWVLTGSGGASAGHSPARAVNIGLGSRKGAIWRTYQTSKFVLRFLARAQHRFDHHHGLQPIRPRLTPDICQS